VAQQSVVLDDVRDVPALAALADKSMPLCSLASAPLTLFGETLGVLIALGTQSHTFLPRDLEVLQSFASQASIAMHNARRYHLTETRADVDGLTGLLNHRSFHEALERALQGSCTGCVVLVDLDHFKRVNDEDGHGAGDRLLAAAAHAMAEACRGDDLAFRVGGDEFALLLRGLDERAAVAVSTRLCAAITALDPRVGASAGVAALARGRSKDAVLKQADELLYATKRSEHRGRSRAASASGAGRVAAEALHAALELRDAPAAARCAEMAELSRRVASRLGAGPAESELARHVALAQSFCDRGADLLGRISGVEELATAVRAVHEPWAGSGRSGEQIPLAARVVAVCEAFATAASRRPAAAALIELERRAGSELDPLVLRALASELGMSAHEDRAAA
jgi:diguanylate cyclase (GGDEF)-like protein